MQMLHLVNKRLQACLPRPACSSFALCLMRNFASSAGG